MLTARARVSAVLLAAALPACEGKPEQQPQQPPPPITSWEVETDVAFPLADPAKAEPLEVFYAKEIVGDGYPRQPVSFGPTLYSGKWLGFAGGHDEFLGDHHIIINHYAGKPRDRYVDPISHSVLLDVDSGEVVARFLRHLRADWIEGLAIVEVEDDLRPHLLDAEAETLVPALPDGDHDYVYGENYWIHLSPIADRVWIYAQDQQGVVHLFEWEDRSKPPPLPNNPFPFLPKWWEPTLRFGDAEEVSGPHTPDTCLKAVLKPPRRYDCLDDEQIADSTPLSQGWRFSRSDGLVFNRLDGQGLDLNSLCTSGTRGAEFDIASPVPPRLTLCCADPSEGCWVWSPEAIYRPSDEISRKVTTSTDRIFHHAASQSYELEEQLSFASATWAERPERTYTAHVIGTDYACSDLLLRAGYGSRIYTVSCRSGTHDRWTEIVDNDGQLRSKRFPAADVAVSPKGVVAVIRGSQSKQRVALVTVVSPAP